VYVQSTVCQALFETLHILIHLISTTSLLDSDYYCPCFIDEEKMNRKLKNLPTAVHLVTAA
jgi:hypothetical protein